MIRREEIMATALARLILDPTAPPARHIAVGAASPIPAAACWLVRALGHDVRLSLLHKHRGNPFTEGTRELFDLAGQGRIDLFFLGGGQIDGSANINLIGTGEWPGTAARFPGSFGSAFMYLMTPRTILFREEHSPRVLVPRVDIISAPGVSAPGVFRRGTAQALVTSRCVFRFTSPPPLAGGGRGEGAGPHAHGALSERSRTSRFTLESVHLGETTESIRAATGFAYDIPQVVPVTPLPSTEQLAALRGPVREQMLETYPEFCRRVWVNPAKEQAA
jgi:glutaconate CoA-transferase subunit B